MTGLKIGELASGLTASPYIVDYVLDGVDDICKAQAPLRFNITPDLAVGVMMSA